MRGLAIAAVMVIVVAVVSRTIIMLWFGVNSSLWFATFTRGDPIATGILLAIVLRGRVPSMPLLVRGLLASFGIGCMIAVIPVGGHRRARAAAVLNGGEHDVCAAALPGPDFLRP
ncbi:MAG TPA: hypothetical protein VGI49_10865, partial [Mycobacterium sp.]